MTDINNKSIILSFAGMAQSFLRVHPQGFKNFLSKSFPDIPSIFFSDSTMNLYQNGMDIWIEDTSEWSRVSNSIDESTEYIKDIIKKYDNIYFVGTSIGGYIAIIYAHLIKDIKIKVLAYLPQLYIPEKLHPDIEQYLDRSKFDLRYMDISDIDTYGTEIILHSDIKISGKDTLHSVDYTRRLSSQPNVKLFEHNGFSMKDYRDSGMLYNDFKSLIIS